MSIDIRDKFFGPNQEKVWSRFAEEIDGSYEHGSLVESKKIITRYEPWLITIDTYSKSIGHIYTTYTRLTADFKNSEGLDFEVKRRNILENFGIRLGMQDIDIGYSDFDQAFVIKGNNEEKIKELFSSDKIRELLMNQPNIHIEVVEKGWFGTKKPVDQLLLETEKVVKDIDRLKELYMLFVLLLNKLSLMEPEEVEEEVEEEEIEDQNEEIVESSK